MYDFLSLTECQALGGVLSAVGWQDKLRVHMWLERLSTCTKGYTYVHELLRVTIVAADYIAPSSLSLAIIPSTSSTFPPPFRGGGSAKSG